MIKQPSAALDRSRRLFLGAGLGAGAGLLLSGRALAQAHPLSITVDTRSAPQLGPWAQELRRRVAKWWPIVTAALASPGYHPPSGVLLQFRTDMPERLAGHTDDNVISINAPYVIAHPTYYNFIGHELVHVVQDTHMQAGGWLVEGIADYIRYYVLFPQDPERFFNPRAGDYRRGYQATAAMLDYVERTHGPGTVRQVNAAMRGGGDGEAALAKLADAPLDQVWAKVLAALTDGSPAPRG